MYSSTLTFFYPPPSDPYVKVTVYDPVNGVLTSVQTKTVKKVSHLAFAGVLVLFGCFDQTLEEKLVLQEV